MPSRFDQAREPGDVEHFTHQRLRLADCDNGKRFPASMRVLELQPAIHATSLLRCRLREVLIAEANITHFYEALSYVWGSSQERKYILCDDRRLSITVNCWTALVALRRPFHKRTLWIDAICIDQAEDEEALKERSQQVRVMGDIYLYARKVLVWLGPGDNSTPRVFMILKAVRRYSKLKPLWMRTRRLHGMPSSKFYESFAFEALDKLLKRDKMTLLEIVNSDKEERLTMAREILVQGATGRCHDEINAIIGHPWFTRVWTLQEIAMSTNTHVIRGNSSMDWDDFLFVVTTFGSGWQAGYGDSAMDLLEGRQNLSWVMSDIFDLVLGNIRSEDPKKAVKSFCRELKFLSSMCDHQATLPIDKIYSIYSILNLINVPLDEPDYARNALDAYQNLTQAWIKSRKNLSIVIFSINHEVGNGSRPARPSWVPDWGRRDDVSPGSQISSKTSYSGVLQLLDFDYLRCRASSTSLVDPEGIFQEPGVLSVKGFSLGGIMDCFSMHSNGNVILNKSEPQTFTMAFRNLCRYVSNMKSCPAGEDLVAVFYRCITYANYAYRPIGGDPVLFSEFRAYVDLMLYPDCKQPINIHLVETRSSPEAPDRLEDFMERLAVNMLDSVGNLNELMGIWDAKMACEHLGDGQAIFILASGYMGNAYYSVQPEDEVFLLAGCPWPMTLRRGENGYKFIAPTYVHGVMTGELWPEKPGEPLVDIKII